MFYVPNCMVLEKGLRASAGLIMEEAFSRGESLRARPGPLKPAAAALETVV